jgi:hypothetical protein
MSELDTSLFVREDDHEDDKGQSPAVTRMLIHCIRKLCKDFYVKPKQSILQMKNTMDAYDFTSVDEMNRPSFLHFDKVIPFITFLSVLPSHGVALIPSFLQLSKVLLTAQGTCESNTR